MKTREEKQEYSRQLRERWTTAKKLLTEEKISLIQAIIASHGWNISATGYAVIEAQMQAQGLDGIPYLDAKTYKGWRENGFQVRKGQKSTLSGITWVNVTGQAEAPVERSTTVEKSGFCFPKAYHLFHRSQVDAIGAVADPGSEVRYVKVA